MLGALESPSLFPTEESFIARYVSDPLTVILPLGPEIVALYLEQLQANRKQEVYWLTLLDTQLQHSRVPQEGLL
jgi:hypothetical protein